MSELRQRKLLPEDQGDRKIGGASSGSSVQIFEIPEVTLYMGGAAGFKDEDIEDIMRSSVLPKNPYVMPSISNRAQAAKDRLATDPTNMDYIRELGFIFASEVQWNLAANVLIRGWKRVSEFKDSSERFTFLMKLAECSFKNKQFRQADAILHDIEPPQQEGVEKKAYQLLYCHTCCEINKESLALKIFNEAVRDESFEGAIKIWAACALRLQKVGGFEVAKSTIENKARGGQNYTMDQSRMQTVESWARMSNEPEEEKPMFSLQDGVQPWMIKAAVAFFLVVFLYILYLLERRSLRNLKLS